MKLGVTTAALLLVILASAGLAGAQSLNRGISEEQRLTDPALFGPDRFGGAVAIDGDTMVVGVPNAFGAQSSGAVYVYSRSGAGWVEEQILRVNNVTGCCTANFGESLVLDGDTLIIGSPDQSGSGVGSTYVFLRSGDTWMQHQELQIAAGNVSLFGSAVAMSGDTLVVGSPPFDSDTGSVHIFNRANGLWALSQDIEVESDDFLVGFGSALGIDGDTLVVGDSGFFGTAHVFGFADGRWVESQVIVGDIGDDFGRSVTMEGDTMVITAPFRNANRGSVGGSAFVYVREGDTWVERQELFVPSSGDDADSFGTDVDLVGDTLVVAQAGGAGAAQLFTPSNDGWAQAATFVGSGVGRQGGFEMQVAIGPDEVVAGFPFSNSGEVYVFDRSNRTASSFCNGLPATVDLAAGEQPTDGPDVIVGTSGPDIINAGAGNDIICAGGGDDIIRAGNGADIVHAGSGDDQVFAGQGRDQVFGDDGDDFVSGGRGKDTLIGGLGNDDLRGNEGTDVLLGAGGDDELRGGQKADVIEGNGGNDVLIGGTRPDVLDGNAGVDTYIGGAGSDICVLDRAGRVESRTSCESEVP